MLMSAGAIPFTGTTSVSQYATFPFEALVSARIKSEHLVIDSGCNYSVFKSKALFKINVYAESTTRG